MKRRVFLSRCVREQPTLLVLLFVLADFGTAMVPLKSQAADDVMQPAVYRLDVGCGSEPNGASGCGCQACTACRCGRDVCCPTMEEVTEEVPCWKVTCEKVCVPAVRLPWEAGGSKLTLFSWLAPKKRACSCGACINCTGGDVCCNTCAPKCGPVRCVSVLAPDSYEVTKCRCKWEIRRLPACRPSSCLQCGEEQISTPEADVSEADALPPPSPEL